MSSAIVAIFANAFLNAHIYPSLLKYQSGSELAKVFNEVKTSAPVYFFDAYSSYAFGFYAQRIMLNIDLNQIAELQSAGNEIWVIGDKDMLKDFNKHQIKWKKEFSVDDFHVTTLTLPFLNPQTRASVTRKIYMVEL